MKPTVEITSQRGNKALLYKEDGLAVVRDGAVIDAVITDPPYIITHVGGGGGIFGVGGPKANNKIASNDTTLLTIRDGYDIKENLAAWLLAGAKNVVCYCSNDQVVPTVLEMQAQGMSTTICVWHKFNAPPMVNFTFVPDIEYFIVGRLLSSDGNEAYFNNDTPAAYKTRCKREPMCTERRWHPTAKPVKLLRQHIEVLCPPDGWVFDPFGGSGSGAIAALEAGRNVIACENDTVMPGCFDRMVEEVGLAASQRNLF